MGLEISMGDGAIVNVAGLVDTIDEPHSYIHSNSIGDYYVYSEQIDLEVTDTPQIFLSFNLASDLDVEAHMSVLIKNVHPRDSNLIFQLKEQILIADPKYLTGFDRNRKRDETHILKIHTGVAMSAGNIIYTEQINRNDSTTEHHHDKMEFILKKTEPSSSPINYAIFLKTQSEGEIGTAQIILNWYETLKGRE